MTDQQTISHFEIVDSRTQKVVTTAKTRTGANRACDSRDAAFGAVRYFTRAIWVDASAKAA